MAETKGMPPNCRDLNDTNGLALTSHEVLSYHCIRRLYQVKG